MDFVAVRLDDFADVSCIGLHNYWRDHITPILRHLHWLPVRRRVELKLAIIVKTLHGLVNHVGTWFSKPCIGFWRLIRFSHTEGIPGRWLSINSSLTPIDVTTNVRRQYVRPSHAAALFSAIVPSLSLDHVCGTLSACWTSPPQPFYRTVP